MHLVGAIERSIDDRFEQELGLRAQGDTRGLQVPSFHLSQRDTEVANTKFRFYYRNVLVETSDILISQEKLTNFKDLVNLLGYPEAENYFDHQ
jgi:hypothetical protein